MWFAIPSSQWTLTTYSLPVSRRTPTVSGALINKEVATLSRRLVTEARQDDTVRRLMTAPGVGVLVALTYVSAIGDPARFTHSSSIGAYVGLTPRRFQSGDTPARSRAAATG